MGQAVPPTAVGEALNHRVRPGGHPAPQAARKPRVPAQSCPTAATRRDGPAPDRGFRSPAPDAGKPRPDRLPRRSARPLASRERLAVDWQRAPGRASPHPGVHAAARPSRFRGTKGLSRDAVRFGVLEVLRHEPVEIAEKSQFGPHHKPTSGTMVFELDEQGHCAGRRPEVVATPEGRRSLKIHRSSSRTAKRAPCPVSPALPLCRPAPIQTRSRARPGERMARWSGRARYGVRGRKVDDRNELGLRLAIARIPAEYIVGRASDRRLRMQP